MLYSDVEFGTRFTAAMAEIAKLPKAVYEVVIESGDVGLPRASGIGSCARQQFMKLTDEPITDPGRSAQNWSSWMGYAGQELSGAVLREMGYQLTVPPLAFLNDVIAVHPDGVLTGLDFGTESVLWDSKVRNVYGYKELVSKPLKAHDVQMYLQMQAGMGALGLTRTMVTVHPHDLSTMRVELARSKITHVPEPVAHRIFVAANKEAQQLAIDRANTLLAAKAMNLMVRREFTPGKDKFPCGYCPWYQRCVTVDLEYSVKEDELLRVPPTPEEWKSET